MMILKFSFGNKICSVAFIENVLPGHEYWGSALAGAAILKIWRLGKIGAKLSLAQLSVSMDPESSREPGSCRARRDTGPAVPLYLRLSRSDSGVKSQAALLGFLFRWYLNCSDICCQI